MDISLWFILHNHISPEWSKWPVAESPWRIHRTCLSSSRVPQSYIYIPPCSLFLMTNSISLQWLVLWAWFLGKNWGIWKITMSFIPHLTKSATYWLHLEQKVPHCCQLTAQSCARLYKSSVSLWSGSKQRAAWQSWRAEVRFPIDS